MKFRIKSSFRPTGDQPQAIKKLVSGLEKRLRHQTLLGVTGSGKTFTMAKIIEASQKPTIVMSHNKTLTAQLYQEFKQFFPDNEVHYFVSYYDYYQPEAYIPKTDTYIEKESSINDKIDQLRHAATQALLSRKDVIIVASVSCIYGLGSPADYESIGLSLKKGDKIKREEFLRDLVRLQYKRNDKQFFRGTFRAAGNAIEIHPVTGVGVIRVEFEEGAVGRILAMESEKPLIAITEYRSKFTEKNHLDIYPAKHFVTQGEKSKQAVKNIKLELFDQLKKLKKMNKPLEAQRLRQRTVYDLEMISQAGYCNGIENYSRHFTFRDSGQPPYVLLDFFPKDYLLFIDESHATVPQIRGMYNGDQSRKKILVEHGFRLPSAKDNRPLKFREFEEKISQAIYVSATPADYELKKSGQVVEQVIRPTGLVDPEIEIRKTENQIADLINEIQKRAKNQQRVLVTTLTKRMAEELADYLFEQKIKVQYLHSDIETLERIQILADLRKGKYDALVGINLLREGLDLPEVSLVAILDADKEGFLRHETSLIQTMGRAARHMEGKVIMYADKTTRSMQAAIKEVNRRRKIQLDYNRKYKIIPKSIIKKHYKPIIES